MPVDRTLSTGAYRLVAAQTPYGDVIVTGLPLADKAEHPGLAGLDHQHGVSLGGLVLIGLAGTVLIRRTMKPLEQLSEVATQVSRLPLDAGEVALAVRVPPSNAHPGTEVGSVGHALNQMLDNVSNALEARQESEMKVRQFVADASHELRTPLTAIRGYTELMRMTENFTPDGQKSLARVQSQSERMTTLVEDLLLLARLDEGQPLKLSDVDLTQLVIETVSDEKVMAPDRTWHLELPEEPVVVRGDASQLHQVLVNLLSNARKHTAPGTTVVTGVHALGRRQCRGHRDGRRRRHPAGIRGPGLRPLRPRRRGPRPGGRRGAGRRQGCCRWRGARTSIPRHAGDRGRVGRGNQRPGPVHCAVHHGSPRRHSGGDVPARPHGIRRAAARVAACRTQGDAPSS